jgi:hypothetical protein
MSRFAILCALALLSGCTPQLVQEFRDHPVRATLLVGGAIALTAIATRDREDELTKQQQIGAQPVTCGPSCTQ